MTAKTKAEAKTAKPKARSRKRYPHEPNFIIPIAPGEHLTEKLEEMGMDKEHFSKKSKLPLEAVDLLFLGRLPVTPNLAAALEKITKIPADLWLRFELGYHEDLKKAAEKYGM
ncbi:MAG TPA: hypothetical protein DEB39_05530 [Planctomycetaceae bacterium]|nr:hypothetical protein [Planctomycetaceae bacterium]